MDPLTDTLWKRALQEGLTIIPTKLVFDDSLSDEGLRSQLVQCALGCYQRSTLIQTEHNEDDITITHLRDLADLWDLILADILNQLLERNILSEIESDTLWEQLSWTKEKNDRQETESFQTVKPTSKFEM